MHFLLCLTFLLSCQKQILVKRQAIKPICIDTSFDKMPFDNKQVEARINNDLQSLKKELKKNCNYDKAKRL
jgi:hypothetical protein